jgi:hypothetical protein
MSELWSVRVAARQEGTLELEVRQTHPDAGPFPESAVFAWRLWYDGAKDGSALHEALSHEDLYDEELMAAHVADYVAGVRVEVERPTLDMGGVQEALRRSGVAEEDLEKAYDRELSSAQATVAGLAKYTVTAAEARWTAGLTKGRLWDSAGYFDPPALFDVTVKKRAGQSVDLQVRQRHIDAPRFEENALFAARLLLEGPAQDADGAPDFAEIQDDAFMAAHVAEYVAGASVAVVRPPLNMAALRELRRRGVEAPFHPDGDTAGAAIYTVTLASAAWLEKLPEGDTWSVRYRPGLFSPRP